MTTPDLPFPADDWWQRPPPTEPPWADTPSLPPPPTSPPPPAAPAPLRRPRWGCGDIFIGIGLVVVSSFVFGIPLVVAGIQEDSLAYEAISAASVWVALGGWSLFASWVKGLGSLKLDFGWAFRWFDPFIGVALAFITIVIGAGLDAVQQAIGVQAASNTGFLVQAAGNGTNWTYLGFILIVAVGAPFVEELFFRGLTFSALQKRYNGIVAVVGSSLIFGILHFQPGDVVPTIFFLVNITIFGLVLGISRYVTKRTGPGVFAHMAFNLTAALAILLTATH
jgi:membrane protease YdiL (CAAX protease family)